MHASDMINRTHALNTAYFDVIDTEEKAYWLGFIWADGNITKTAPRGSGPNRLRIAQKWSEKDHLERFKAALSANYTITCIKHPNGHEVAQLDINSRSMCQSLQTLGYDTKDKRTHIPAIPHDLMPHFIRGYFDGDGCLSIYTQTIKKWTVNKQEWSVTCNKDFAVELKDTLTTAAGTTPTVKLKSYRKSPNTVSLRYGKKSDIAKLYAYMYKNASVYLNTKHQKFIEFFSRNAS